MEVGTRRWQIPKLDDEWRRSEETRRAREEVLSDLRGHELHQGGTIRQLDPITVGAWRKFSPIGRIPPTHSRILARELQVENVYRQVQLHTSHQQQRTWLPRLRSRAVRRRTSPSVLRSVKVSLKIPQATGTRPLKEHGPTDNCFLQASSSSALPVSSPRSTIPSSTSPISRTSKHKKPSPRHLFWTHRRQCRDHLGEMDGGGMSA